MRHPNYPASRMRDFFLVPVAITVVVLTVTCVEGITALLGHRTASPGETTAAAIALVVGTVLLALSTWSAYVFGRAARQDREADPERYPWAAIRPARFPRWAMPVLLALAVAAVVAAVRDHQAAANVLTVLSLLPALDLVRHGVVGIRDVREEIDPEMPFFHAEALVQAYAAGEHLTAEVR